MTQMTWAKPANDYFFTGEPITGRRPRCQASVTGVALDSSGNPTSASVALSSIQQFL